jgi:hypothetical protein
LPPLEAISRRSLYITRVVQPHAATVALLPPAGCPGWQAVQVQVEVAVTDAYAWPRCNLKFLTREGPPVETSGCRRTLFQSTKQGQIEVETRARQGGSEEPAERTWWYVRSHFASPGSLRHWAIHGRRRHRSGRRSIAKWICLKMNLFGAMVKVVVCRQGRACGKEGPNEPG